MRGLLVLAVLVVALAAGRPAAAQTATPSDSPLSTWAGFFMSGDYRAHSGAPAEVFDNGRRDVGAAFVAAGLKAENTVQFSVMNMLHQDSPEMPKPLTPGSIDQEMARMTQQARGGCLFFYTSHGGPGVLLMGDSYEIQPDGLNQLLNSTCGPRPTVIVLSACYSGSFIPALAAPNRMILTAAREDRTSFGCGQEDTYTFFDGCLLEALPKAGTFDALADMARACVTRRETDLKADLPSEPQVSVGDQFRALLPTLRLRTTQTASTGPPVSGGSTATAARAGRGP